MGNDSVLFFQNDLIKDNRTLRKQVKKLAKENQQLRKVNLELYASLKKALEDLDTDDSYFNEDFWYLSRRMKVTDRIRAALAMARGE